MAESNQLMDFTDMFRATEENDENLGANMHITNGLVKASGEDPTSLELYYPEVPAQDFRELPASVHTLLTNLVSQVRFLSRLFFIQSQFDSFRHLTETLLLQGGAEQ